MSRANINKTVFIASGAVFAAMFFVSSNIIPPIYILPGVPVTFQILIVALMAGILGVKGSLMTLGAVYGLTLVGLPMMSGFSGGIGAFARPSGGFIIGWVFLALTVGIYRDYIEPKINTQRENANKRVISLIKTAGFIVAGIIGVMLDYACGAVSMSFYNGTSFLFNFIANIIAYSVLDTAKIVIAMILCRAFEHAMGRIISFRRFRKI